MEKGGIEEPFSIIIRGGADGVFSEFLLRLPLSSRLVRGLMLPLSCRLLPLGIIEVRGEGIGDMTCITHLSVRQWFLWR